METVTAGSAVRWSIPGGPEDPGIQMVIEAMPGGYQKTVLGRDR
jgi:hypothetical protein